MKLQRISFNNKTVNYRFNGSLASLHERYGKAHIVIITDENVYRHQFAAMEPYRCIVTPAGEKYKQQAAVDDIIARLLEWECDRQTIIAGVGGGVVTDIAGYAASIFKRGVHLIQVPCSILAMVDAAVGGKNGVDVGAYKNQVGTIYQPEEVLFDYGLLRTLPREEWVNGFAEIIKHACIRDAALFSELERSGVDDFMNDEALCARMIERNVAIKLNIVLNDEHETGERKLLNFGHTLGHAIEAKYNLPHGHAISIGMMAAARLSERLAGLDPKATAQLETLCRQYGLPVKLTVDHDALWQLMINDKKRSGNQMSFILLRSIGEAVVQNIPLNELKILLKEII